MRNALQKNTKAVHGWKSLRAAARVVGMTQAKSKSKDLGEVEEEVTYEHAEKMMEKGVAYMAAAEDILAGMLG